MDLTPVQLEDQADEMLRQAEERRYAADVLLDEAEALRNVYLVSHERVVGCAANLPEAAKQELREVKHFANGCPCEQIRARHHAAQKLALERELKAKAAADKISRQECRKQQERENRQGTINRKQLPTMAARRTSTAGRFDPLQAKDGKKPSKILGEKTQPKADAPSQLDAIMTGQQKTHGAL